MKSTRQSARHFFVLSGPAGELQRFEYIEGDKFRTRKAAFDHADKARMRWQNNHWKYRDAKFTITDTGAI